MRYISGRIGYVTERKYLCFLISIFNFYFHISQTISICNSIPFEDDGIEDDFEDIEDRQSLADYYGWDDGRAGTNLFDVFGSSD